jgi:hypothetical protein
MIKQIDRGWQGHFCCHCRFHLNTLLEREDGFKVVVSTVGYFYDTQDKVQTIGANRYFETMVFESSYDKYDDINVGKQIFFDSQWAYSDKDDMLPQAGHWVVVDEIKNKMENKKLNPLPDE